MSHFIINPYVYAATGLADIDNVYSMEFDGVDDSVEVEGAVPFNFTGIAGTAPSADNPWSVSAWVKGSVTGAFLDFPMYNINVNYARSFAIGWSTTVTASGSIFFGSKYTIKGIEDGTTAYDTTDWNHIVITYDGGGYSTIGEYNLYIGGNPIAITTTGTNPGDFQSNQLNIGMVGNYGGTLRWTGGVDEVGLFDYVLSPSDVTSIFDGTSTGKTADLSSMTTPPVGWYRMGD